MFLVKKELGVIHFAELDAYNMARTLGKLQTPEGPEWHLRGQYQHYHTHNHLYVDYYEHFHIWFGNPV